MKWLARLGALSILLMVAGVYLAWGYFQLAPDEQAVVLRLGRHVRTLGPGPHFHMPFVETVERERVEAVRREEFGFRTLDPNPPQQYEENPYERRMLTGDSNLVDLEFVVQWQISDIAAYRFNVARVPTAIRDVAQAAVREIVAQRPIDSALTSDKGAIALAARDLMQQVLDEYGAGIVVRQVQLQEMEPPEAVKDAFRDIISAEQDKERLVLEAQGYADQVVPVARGEAEALINEARGYSEALVLEATGDAVRFNLILDEYLKAPEVTRERLYIETLEQILPGMEKVIVEEGNAERVLPYLPLGARGAAR